MKASTKLIAGGAFVGAATFFLLPSVSGQIFEPRPTPAIIEAFWVAHISKDATEIRGHLHHVTSSTCERFGKDVFPYLLLKCRAFITSRPTGPSSYSKDDRKKLAEALVTTDDEGRPWQADFKVNYLNGRWSIDEAHLPPEWQMK